MSIISTTVRISMESNGKEGRVYVEFVAVQAGAVCVLINSDPQHIDHRNHGSHLRRRKQR